MRILFFILFLFLTISNCFSQDIKVNKGEKFKYSKGNVMFEVSYFPIVNIPFGEENYTATAIQFTYGYTLNHGYYARTQFLNRISLGEGLEKYYEFMYLNIGKMFNNGKRFQVPVSFSIGTFSFKNEEETVTSGIRLGAHSGFRFFFTDNFSLRGSISIVPYFNLKDTGNRESGEKINAISRIGFGVEYSFAR